MFTGIVEEIGEVVDLTEGDGSARLSVRGPTVARDAVLGASIAVDGTCLTVTRIDGDVVDFDVMPQTLRHSALGDRRAGHAVNLERAMPATGRFGGHIVQGHVDGGATLLSREPGAAWDELRFSLPAELARYVVAQGSITIDGVSLTVAGLGRESSGEEWFAVSLIPTTLADTTLGRRVVGDTVNLEVDVLAKYVERMMGDRNVGERGVGAPPATSAGTR